MLQGNVEDMYREQQEKHKAEAAAAAAAAAAAGEADPAAAGAVGLGARRVSGQHKGNRVDQLRVDTHRSVP